MNRKLMVSVLAMMLLVFGMQGMSYAQTLSASSTQPLTEAALQELGFGIRNGITLTLHGGHIYEASEDIVARHVKVSGIAGVTLRADDVTRLDDTRVKINFIFEFLMAPTSTAPDTNSPSPSKPEQ